MTPLPATPDTALQVPATPITPVSTAATGTSNQVLATGATAPKKRKGGRVVVTATEFLSLAQALYQQVQGVPADEAFAADTPEALRDILAGYSSIDHLSMLMHMVSNEILFGIKQVTLSQLQTIIDGSVPPIARWSFEGCDIGWGATALQAFASHFGVGRMEGWTHFHLIDVWGKTVTGIPSAAQIAAIHPEVERASNYLTKGDAGATYSASEIEAQMQQGVSVSLYCEVFTYHFDDTLTFAKVLNEPEWVDGLTGQPIPRPWTVVSNPENARYPRSAAITQVVSNAQEASAFEQSLLLNPVLTRVVVVSPAKGP